MTIDFVLPASFKPVIIASRKSELARKQTEIVRARLLPVPSEMLGMSTIGDEVLDRPLEKVGGKGVFSKTLEVALLDGRADAAVHSMKDMETELTRGTTIGAVLPREDCRDALVGQYASIDALPVKASIGTAPVRRAALLRHLRPDLRIGLLRGNVNSRIARLKSGEFDALILAVSGLKRLQFDIDYIPLSEEVMPAAAAQGALALQVRTGTERAAILTPLFSQLNCSDTETSVTAERAVLAKIDGSCQTPLSAMARLSGVNITVTACLLSKDGVQKFEAKSSGLASHAAEIGAQVGEQLLAQCGGRSFLE